MLFSEGGELAPALPRVQPVGDSVHSEVEVMELTGSLSPRLVTFPGGWYSS